MTLNRRDAIKGVGFLGLGFLFRGLAGKLVSERATPVQLPSAIDIDIEPQIMFRAERLVVPDSVGRDFVIENIYIGSTSQLAAAEPLSAEVFSPDAVGPGLMLDAAGPGTRIRFRVRYVGKKPGGDRFVGALYGSVPDGRRMVLPIDSGVQLV